MEDHASAEMMQMIGPMVARQALPQADLGRKACSIRYSGPIPTQPSWPFGRALRVEPIVPPARKVREGAIASSPLRAPDRVNDRLSRGRGRVVRPVVGRRRAFLGPSIVGG